MLHGSQLLLHAAHILDCTLGSALTPSSHCPAALRLDSITVAAEIIQLLKEHAGVTKLKSFAYHAKQTEASLTAAEKLSLVACKCAAQKTLQHLLDALDDTDDKVRISCLLQISACTNLILSNSDLLLRTHDSAPIKLSYAEIVINLLKQGTTTITTGDSSAAHKQECEEYFQYLNDTLRVVCVLDPTEFENIVRTELAPLLTATTQVETIGEEVDRDSATNKEKLVPCSGCSSLNDFVSDLLNHVDVLLQFS